MKKRILSILLTVIMVVSFAAQDFRLLAEEVGRSPKDATALLVITEKTLSQDGKQVLDGQKIEVTRKVGFSVKTDIPIRGDFNTDPIDWDDFVIKGDTAEIVLAENFSLLEDVNNLVIMGSKIGESQKQYTVGHVDLVREGADLKAKIRFDGDDEVFDGTLSNLQAWITGEVYESRTEAEITTHDPIVRIFGKNYHLSYNPKIEATIKKTLVLNEKGELSKEHINQRILEWKVVVNAYKVSRGESLPIDLGGYILADIFSQEEATKTGEFKTIGTTLDEKILVNNEEKVLTTAATAGGFEYVFEAGTTGEQTIVFHTTFDGKELFQPEVDKNRDYKKKNTVKLLDRTRKEIAQDTAEVRLKSLDLFYKGTTGLSSDSVPVPNKPLGHYYHTWQLIVNKQGIRMENVAVIDRQITNSEPVDADAMKFISAHWEEPADERWKTSTDVSTWKWKKVESIPVYTVAPADFTYTVGNIDTPRRLVIKAHFNLENYNSVSKRYNNIFYPRWDSMTVADAEKRPIFGYMQVGPKPMVKSPDSIANSFQKKWSITIRENATNTYSDLRVFDVLPFVPAFQSREELRLEDGTSRLYGIEIKDMFHKDGNSSFQKYVGNFEAAKGEVELTVHKLYNRKNQHVADLLEFKGKSKDPAQPGVKVDEWKFSYHTESFDQEIIFDNIGRRRDMLNTATLFNNTERLDESKVTNGFYSDMLKKEMLAANAWQAGEQNWSAQIVNEIAANERRGYHHGENAVIYRISINNGNHQHLLDAFGGIRLTDTLPVGWEFVKMTDTDDYLIFAAEPKDTIQEQRQSIKAKGEPVKNLNITTNHFIGNQEAVLTIAENLKSPYVLLLKAAPKANALQNYVKEYIRTGNEPEATNQIKLESVKNLQNLPENKRTVRSQQKVKFTPIVLDKFSDAEFRPAGVHGTGVLEWTIEYSPRKLGLSAGATDLWLVDQLQGEMLLKQEDGHLVISGKFLFAETMVNGDGSLGENIRLLPLIEGDNLFYDSATKILKVKIPDKDKAYRLVYEADISNGTPLLNVQNTVVLQGTDVQVEKRSESYRVDQHDVAAKYELNSLVEVKKVDSNNKPLKGAEFSLTPVGGMETRKETNQLGSLRFTNLSANTEYVLKETKAPAGYNLTAEEHIVTVDGDGKVRIDGALKKTLTVTNTSRIPLKINVTKKWNGAKTPVTIKVYNDRNQEVDSVQLTEDAPRHSFTVYEIDTDGNPLRYRVVEEPVPVGYRMSMNVEPASDAQGYLMFAVDGSGQKVANVTITNTDITIPQIDVKVTKQWIGQAENSLEVELLRNGQPYLKKTLTQENNWEHIFRGLDEKPLGGANYVYTVRESGVDRNKYLAAPAVPAKDNSGNIIANQWVLTNTNKETVDVKVEKRWVGFKQNSVVVHLLQDGQRMVGKAPLILTEAEGWQGSFDGLAKYKPKHISRSNPAELHVYTVEEEAIAGYDIGIAGKEGSPYHLIITNTQKPTKPTDPFRPEDPKPEDPKPEDPKPEDPKPETPKPEDPKPETPKSETPKPEDPAPAPSPEPAPTPDRPTPEGELDIPDGDIPQVLVPPKNGIIELDGNHWKYIPDPNFYGKDKVQIKITRPDGTEYIEEIEIDIPVPQGATTLPKTAGIPQALYWMLGSGLLGIALVLKKRR